VHNVVPSSILCQTLSRQAQIAHPQVAVLTMIHSIFAIELMNHLAPKLRSENLRGYQCYTFVPTDIWGVEDAEYYRPGEFLPISIGDIFAQGRYKILHKLGQGGSSTIWLAREFPNTLVTLKAMCASLSMKAPSQLPDIAIPSLLQHWYQANFSACSLQVVGDYFLVGSPNGIHQIIIHPLEC
jgi:hypothetical protein